MPPEDPERAARWEAAWRHAVLSATVPVVLLGLEGATLLELSTRAAELLGTTPQESRGTSYLDMAERRQEAEFTVRLAQQGMLDGIRTRRSFPRPDGTAVELQSTSWAIRSPGGPDFGLWVLAEGAPGAKRALVAETLVPEGPFHAPSPGPDPVNIALGSLDEDWRIARISLDAARWFGQGAAELIGTRFLDLSRADDLDVLLLALARATTDPEASVVLRLRGATGAEPTVRTVITLDPDSGTFDFALLPGREWGTDRQARTEKLAEHLRHIAVEVLAAEVMGMEEETISLGMPASVGLSGRQWDIVNRLVRGERVTNIAAEMYLSPSTVRNHLAAIFRKAGVHSQQELLALLRGHSGSPSET